MDYQLFLLAAIKERHDATGDTRRAVREGIARTGRPITNAALIMIVVFIAFGVTGPIPPTELGVTLALAVLLDATVDPHDARPVAARACSANGPGASRLARPPPPPHRLLPLNRQGRPCRHPCSSASTTSTACRCFSYLIGDTTTGRAVVVDPQRDVGEYLADAEANGLTIELVIETHFHADFLSGHLELAAATGADDRPTAPSADTEFPIDPLADGERLSLGEVDARDPPHARATRRSRSASSSTSTPDAEPYGVLTGDTLFIGDVGRPDLLSSVGLHRRRARPPALPLAARAAADAARRHPGVPGPRRRLGLRQEPVDRARRRRSASSERPTTPSRPMTEDQFVDAVTEGQRVAPLYFALRRRRQPAATASCSTTTSRRPPLDRRRGARPRRPAAPSCSTPATPRAFAAGHLRGSINVGLDGRFAEYAGDVVRPGQPIVLVADTGRGTEAKVRLARIGFDGVVGERPRLEAVLADHPELADRRSRLTAADVAAWLADDPDLQVVDVRNPGETRSAAPSPAPATSRCPSCSTASTSSTRPRPTVVYCAGGYRSSIAAAALRAHGFTDVADLLGGYGAWLTHTTTHLQEA